MAVKDFGRAKILSFVNIQRLRCRRSRNFSYCLLFSVFFLGHLQIPVLGLYKNHKNPFGLVETMSLML